MAFLYFKNTTTTGVWDDVTNWFTDAACTTQAANVPWVAGDSTYLGYDLTRSADSVTAEDLITINADIGNGFTITGTCDIATISAGTLVIADDLFGGTWSGDGILLDSTGSVNNGTIITGNAFNLSSGVINGGTFSGNSFNHSGMGYIYGGKFSGSGTYTNNNIFGGLFDTTTGLSNPIGVGGVLVDFTLLSTALFLGSASWSSGPWYEDYEGTIPWTGNLPWTDSTTQTKNIFRANSGELWNVGSTSISIDTTIGNSFNITGTCYIVYAYDGSNGSDLSNISYIYDGTFISSYMVNNGSIYGGTFTGSYFYNLNGYIYDGTFSGQQYFYNSYTIYGGTFTVDYFDNSSGSYVFGGTFSGDSYTMQSGSYIYGGTWSGNDGSSSTSIYGGIFTGNTFYNYGYIEGGTFSGDNLNNTFEIKGGIFASSGFSNSGYIYGGYWLESGFLDIDIFDYSNGSLTPTITGQIRIDGAGANVYPFDLATLKGFMTLKIKGQDVLGAGLL